MRRTGVSTLAAHGPISLRRADTDEHEPFSIMRRHLAAVTIVASLTFNLGLCFVNTRAFATTDSIVMMAEMLIIGGAFLAALSKRVDFFLLLVAYVSYMVLLFAMRGEIDLKGLRDVLIPIAFYFMGINVKSPKLGDALVVVAVILMLGFGLFEYLLLETYLDNFNVLGYFIARGSVDPALTYGQTRGLFISGMRPEPRTLLPFLGQHRVSSVMLEPVSAGNIGAICFGWALFRNSMRWRYAVMAAALAIVIMADSRFGFLTCILMVFILPVYRFIPRTAWLVLPFLFLAVIAGFGLATGTDGGANDIVGRLKVTAALLTQLDFAVVLGIQTTAQFTADSGLAYTLTKFGLFGFIALWAVLAFAPVADKRAWAFHSMVMIYLLMLMLISNSFYSIKTGALLWFLLGTSNATQWATYKLDDERKQMEIARRNLRTARARDRMMPLRKRRSAPPQAR
ncbi:UDP-phosphate alpha N-acetylglucosaminyltransferase [Peteryoungia desertarenae]|uniref:UDP-phosphate alpha N-acetylglucosaminyltransferase n=1 Tax=Peteryoungia desertarenae TaxID=1813451 RepID=A0ABX6QIU2_9HYPH|nr:UDP-phosphate alpha N-acetylglucosaminyltransferase [Peteryoungia desertarenae]QLF68212.1 UDP-phosphate alpha N-acetylglucosaminyltransferase [Peteryoungia desertarenae]